MARPNMTQEDLEKMLKGSPARVRGACLLAQPGKRDAGSNPAPAPTNKNAKYAPYKNKLEHSYAQVLHSRKLAGHIKDWGYETQSLKLAAGKYHRPDFTVWRLDGTVEMAQTKGYHKNMRAGMAGLIWAAQRHPWFIFTLHRYKNGWQSEEVRP